MSNLNRVMLTGNLTADPEARTTAGGVSVASLRLASNRKFKDGSGQVKEDTLYVDVTCWKGLADNCCQYLSKGSRVAVEGRLKLDTWEDRNGEKRSKIQIEADNVEFLDRPEKPDRR